VAAGTPRKRLTGKNTAREAEPSSTTPLRPPYLFVPFSHARSHLLGSKIEGNFLKLLLLLGQAGGR